MHEFDYIPPPSGIRTTEDVAEFLENDVRRYLYAAGELNDIDSGVASGILMDVAEATECLATLLRTNSLPEMRDARADDIEHLEPLLRKCVLVGEHDGGHAMNLIAETLEQIQTPKPSDETSDTAPEECESSSIRRAPTTLPDVARQVAEQLRHELTGRLRLIGDFVNRGLWPADEGYDEDVASLACQSGNLCEALAAQLETGVFDGANTSTFKSEEGLEKMLVRLCENHARGEMYGMADLVGWLREARKQEQA